MYLNMQVYLQLHSHGNQTFKPAVKRSIGDSEMAQQNQLETGGASNSDELSIISLQLQECIKHINYGGQRYKDHPIQKLIPKDVRDKYFQINNMPHIPKWQKLCEGVGEYSLSRKETDVLNSNLHLILRAFKEWDKKLIALAAMENNIDQDEDLCMDEVMDVWLFGCIIFPLLGQPGHLIERVTSFLDKVEDEPEMEMQARDQEQSEVEVEEELYER